VRLFYFALLLSFGVIGSETSLAQQVSGAQYFVHHYEPSLYKAHAQNWQIVQNPLGLIFIANNNGILVYDGVKFSLFETPNSSVVRSLHTYENRVFYGAQNDFGYLEADSTGSLQFNSLVAQLDSTERNVRDIWKIYSRDSTIYFYSVGGIFAWNQHTIQKLKPSTYFYFPFLLNDGLLIQEPNIQIGNWEDDTVRVLPGGNFFLDKPFFFAADYQGEAKLIATESHGLFIWKDAFIKPLVTSVDHLLKKGQIYHGFSLKNGHYAISTRKFGSFIFDENGKVLHRFSKETGLPSDIHWSIFEDRLGDIWITTDHGIVQVHLKEGLQILNEKNGLSGSVESVTYFNDKLLVGTRSGFAKLESDGQFVYDDIIQSEVWDLLPLKNSVLIATVNGIYEWNGLQTRSIIPSEDGLTWLSLHQDKKTNQIYGGTLKGVYELLHIGSSWKTKRIFESDEEIREILTDSLGNIWLQTRYTGIVQLRVQTRGDNLIQIKRYQEKKPLNSNIVRIFEDENGLLLHDIDSFYRYNSEIDTIFVDAAYRAYHQLKNNTYIHRIERFDSVQIDFPIWNDHYFVRAATPNGISSHRLDLWEGFYNPISIAQWANESIFALGGSTNLLIWNPFESKSTPSQSAPLIRTVTTNRTNLFYGGYRSLTFKPTPFYAPLKTIRFDYAAVQFGTDALGKYQFRLQGLDSTWSPLTSETFVEFTNLDAGLYAFQVRYQHPDLSLSPITNFNFLVVNHWYKTSLFYLFASFLILVLVSYSSRFISIKPLIARISRLEIEQKMLVERERISKELHDNIGTQLIQLVSGLELAQAYQKKENVQQAQTLVSELKEETRATITQLKQTVWTLHTGTIHVQDFIIRLQDMLLTQLKHHPEIGFKRSINEDIFSDFGKVIIKPDTALHAFRIIQEACNNSIKYASANEIRFLVDYSPKSKQIIRIQLSDNGVGFNIHSQSKGFGLDNIISRAKQAGFIIDISSEIGKGTQIHLDWSIEK
jgi:signal transduction histidine kinase